MRIWLDEIHDASTGFTHCHSINEAIQVILKHESKSQIELIACDRYLGDYTNNGGDGIN